ISVLSLANNHALDFGQDAMLETIRRARAGGVRTVGAGRNADEAYEPEIVELRGMRIGFLSFSRVLPDRSWAAADDWPGVASGYSPKRVLTAIDSLSGWVDAVVVLMHWGNEAQDTPLTADRDLAEQMVRHGATAVVGHHPHVVQGLEWTHGSFIAYSLGNFLFPGSRRTDSGVLLLTLRKGSGVIAARFVPLRLAGGAPQRVTAAEAGKALQRLGAAVAPAGLSVASDGEILARNGAARSEHGTGGTP
ncbi:MAG TPA: CapA family protein, partial [Longimicrobiales bacterium]